MERAGAGVARAVEQIAPDGPVAVVCGKGNNGGDGLVVARLLRQAGREVNVLCSGDRRTSCRGDARANLERLPGPAPAAPGRQSVAAAAERGTRGAPAHGAPAPARRRSSTRCSAPASHGEPRGAVARGDRGDQRAPARRWSAWTCPAAWTPPAERPPRGASRRCGRSPSTRPSRGCGSTPARQHAGEVETTDIGIPRGAPGAGARRADRGRRAGAAAAPRGATRPSSSPGTCSSSAARAG